MAEAKTPVTTEPELDVEVGLTIDQLPLKARLRLENSEKWVAWAPDGKSVIVAGDSLEEVCEAASRAGFPLAALEWVPQPFRQDLVPPGMLLHVEGDRIILSPDTSADSTERFGADIDLIPVEALLRLKHAEKWVAWAPDQQSIIASGDTHAEVREAARQAGFARAIMEWVPPPYRQ